jgi:hypothetical protein
MSFLRGIGSNTSINCFALNLKNGQQVNPDVDICSKLNSEMYLRLSSFDNRRTCKRIPLSLARSYVDEEKYGICVVQQKFEDIKRSNQKPEFEKEQDNAMVECSKARDKQ